MSFIQVVGLNHSYGERIILEDINLKIHEGSTFALIGPTGAGKTTLLRLIGLLEKLGSGKIYYNGTDVTKSNDLRLKVRRRIAFVLQKPQVFNLSVYDNVACGLRWRGVKKGKIDEKVHHILEMVGLESYKKKNARTLSGGEAQRVALARAMVVEPEVLLLDEPTANLDPNTAAKVEQLISYVVEQNHTTIIMSTHDMSQGQQLADRIGVIINGKIVQVGDAKQIFRLPEHKEVANFVGMQNMIGGRVCQNSKGVAVVDIGNSLIETVSDSPVGQEVYVGIRPEDITIALSNHKSSARNCFFGKVSQVTSQGPVSQVEVDCGFLLVALVTNLSLEDLDLRIGKEVYASFKATRVHLIKRR